MQDVFGNLLAKVERFLRWIYPGLLLLALLHLGRTTSLLEWDALSQQAVAVQVFALVAAAIVASILIYAAQRYFLHEVVVQYLLFLCGKGDAFNYAKHNCESPPLRRRCCPTAFWEWSSRLNVESYSLGEGYSNLRDYAWGVTHALGLSSWVIWIGWALKDDGSTLDRAFWWLLALSISFFALWLWQELRNVLPPLWGNIGELKRLLRSDSVLPPGLHGS